MLKYSKKTFFFFIYFINILGFFLKGILVTKTIVFCNIIKFNLINVISFVKYNLLAGFSSLLDIIVVDNVNLNYNRFEVTYLFWNVYYGQRLGIKLHTTQFNGIMSISSYFPNANWLEREVWDMFGIKFLMHSNLCRILTDYGFKGFPLRKDFPLTGYLDLFYDNSLQAMRYLPVEFSQNMRFFNLVNPWN
jgi:NADH-quinone oxidoreductase subunit C